MWYANAHSPDDTRVRKILINEEICSADLDDDGQPGTDIDYAFFRTKLAAGDMDLNPKNVTHIRATAGHSKSMNLDIGCSVCTQDVVADSSFSLQSHPKYVFHGTTMANFISIMSDHCIKPGGISNSELSRPAVFLSPVWPKQRTGKHNQFKQCKVDSSTQRREENYEIVLVVDFRFFLADGNNCYYTANGYFTTAKQIYSGYISFVYNNLTSFLVYARLFCVDTRKIMDVQCDDLTQQSPRTVQKEFCHYCSFEMWVGTFVCPNCEVRHTYFDGIPSFEMSKPCWDGPPAVCSKLTDEETEKIVSWLSAGRGYLLWGMEKSKPENMTITRCQFSTRKSWLNRKPGTAGKRFDRAEIKKFAKNKRNGHLPYISIVQQIKEHKPYRNHLHK